jgi:AmmeMemoRadiSam system protein B
MLLGTELSGSQKLAVRLPAVAGSFYPGEAAQLERMLASLLATASAKPDRRTRAVIVPHAGYMYSAGVAAEAFVALTALKESVARLVVLGPAHFVAFQGIAASGAETFRTPLGDMPVDTHAIHRIARLPQVVVDDKPHLREHALEVELPFLQVTFGKVPIVPLLVGTAADQEVVEILQYLWDDSTVIVVSSDLSHYHNYAAACRIDQATAAAVERCDASAIGREDACGSVAIRGLLIETKHRGFRIERLALTNSGDTGGDRSSVVGYGAWVVRKN